MFCRHTLSCFLPVTEGPILTAGKGRTIFSHRPVIEMEFPAGGRWVSSLDAALLNQLFLSAQHKFLLFITVVLCFICKRTGQISWCETVPGPAGVVKVKKLSQFLEGHYVFSSRLSSLAFPSQLSCAKINLEIGVGGRASMRNLGLLKKG